VYTVQSSRVHYRSFLGYDTFKVVSALKMLPQGDSQCKMAGTGIQVSCYALCSNVYQGLWQSAAFSPRIAMNGKTVLRIATDRSSNLRADFHWPDLTACIPVNLSAELGNPQST
jgi:hypothetical protein